MTLDIKNLSKKFDGKQEVLNGINLRDEVNTLAIIGGSGGGKSTLLRILGGLIEANSGEAIVNGKLAADDESYRKQVGFVFQQGGLFSHLSARDNITLPLIKVHGMSKDSAAQIADDLLIRFGLIEDAGKKPSQLSGGQRQRICIARAVAPNPKVLLLDEPTSALDPEYTSEVLNMISELEEKNLSFIIATHEMGFALHACEKVAFLDGGKVIEYGASGDIFRNPQTDKLRNFLSKLLEWKV